MNIEDEELTGGVGAVVDYGELIDDQYSDQLCPRENRTSREIQLESSLLYYTKCTTFGDTIKRCKKSTKNHFNVFNIVKNDWRKSALHRISNNLSSSSSIMKQAHLNFQKSITNSRSTIIDLEKNNFSSMTNESKISLLDALLDDLLGQVKSSSKIRFEIIHYLKFQLDLIKVCFNSNFFDFNLINNQFKRMTKIFIEAFKAKFKDELSNHSQLIQTIREKMVHQEDTQLRATLKRLETLGNERTIDFMSKVELLISNFQELTDVLGSEFSNNEIKRKLDATYLYMKFSQFYKEVGVDHKSSQSDLDVRGKSLSLNQESPFYKKFSIKQWFNLSKSKYTDNNEADNYPLEKRTTLKLIKISDKIGTLDQKAKEKNPPIPLEKEAKIRTLKFLQFLRDTEREFRSDVGEQNNSLNKVQKELGNCAFSLTVDLESKLFQLYWKSKERFSEVKRHFLLFVGEFKSDNPAHSVEVSPFQKDVKFARKLIFKVMKNYRKDFIKFIMDAKEDFISNLKVTNNNEFKEMGIHKIIACQIMLNRCEEDFSLVLSEIANRLEKLARQHDLEDLFERPINLFVDSLKDVCNCILQQFCWSSDQFLVCMRTYSYLAVTTKRGKKAQMKKIFEKVLLLFKYYWGEVELLEAIENHMELQNVEEVEEPIEEPPDIQASVLHSKDINLNKIRATKDKEIVILSSNKNFVIETESVGEGFEEILNPNKSKSSRNKRSFYTSSKNYPDFDDYDDEEPIDVARNKAKVIQELDELFQTAKDNLEKLGLKEKSDEDEDEEEEGEKDSEFDRLNQNSHTFEIENEQSSTEPVSS